MPTITSILAAAAATASLLTSPALAAPVVAAPTWISPNSTITRTDPIPGSYGATCVDWNVDKMVVDGLNRLEHFPFCMKWQTNSSVNYTTWFATVLEMGDTCKTWTWDVEPHPSKYLVRTLCKEFRHSPEGEGKYRWERPQVNEDPGEWGDLHANEHPNGKRSVMGYLAGCLFGSKCKRGEAALEDVQATADLATSEMTPSEAWYQDGCPHFTGPVNSSSVHHCEDLHKGHTAECDKNSPDAYERCLDEAQKRFPNTPREVLDNMDICMGVAKLHRCDFQDPLKDHATAKEPHH